MARCERPEWFKFWRRNREMIDVELLDMKSRGVVFTNMMRYFDGDRDNMEDMTPVECMAFNFLKSSIDDSFEDFDRIADRNRENGRKGGRPKKNPENPVGFTETQKTQTNPENQKTEDRGQKIEDRGQKKEAEPTHAHGGYGWVKLSDSQYQKLLQEFGQAELDRCIQYIDEAAQSSGNKNKWKDWYLVVRRCHRDGWGLRQGTQKTGDTWPGKANIPKAY